MKKSNKYEEPLRITWGCFYIIIPSWIAKGRRLPFWYCLLMLAAWWLWLIHGSLSSRSRG